jgi:hypothetical protein
MVTFTLGEARGRYSFQKANNLLINEIGLAVEY